jgi:hypothetical protein
MNIYNKKTMKNRYEAFLALLPSRHDEEESVENRRTPGKDLRLKALSMKNGSPAFCEKRELAYEAQASHQCLSCEFHLRTEPQLIGKGLRAKLQAGRGVAFKLSPGTAS